MEEELKQLIRLLSDLLSERNELQKRIDKLITQLQKLKTMPKKNSLEEIKKKLIKTFSMEFMTNNELDLLGNKQGAKDIQDWLSYAIEQAYSQSVQDCVEALPKKKLVRGQTIDWNNGYLCYQEEAQQSLKKLTK